MLIGGLPERRRAGQPAERAEVARHGLLAVGGFDRTRVRGVTRVTDLFRPGVLEVHAVVLEGHVGQLHVVVVELREVGRQAAAEQRRVGRARVDRHAAGTAFRGVLVEADDADLDVLRAVAAPVPQLALDDRTADVEAVVADVLDRRAGAGAARLQFRRDVVVFKLLVGPERAGIALETIGAALGHEVDADAAGLLRHVRAARGDLHFFEHVEVVVDRGRAGRGHVGDVDAVNRPLVVAGRGTA